MLEALPTLLAFCASIRLFVAEQERIGNIVTPLGRKRLLNEDEIAPAEIVQDGVDEVLLGDGLIGIFDTDEIGESLRHAIA